MDRVFSGIQPTGTLHLGNYLGAVSNWVALQERADLHRIYCIVDYHAITADYDPKDLGQRTLSLARDLLACGIDPEKSTLFVQSHVPEHTELAWVFQSCASYGDLQRMTQFKSKGEHQAFVSSGLFTYPVLQAADILLYDANLVPVGEDQVQHLELTRDVARRFNMLFGECFPEVDPLLTEATRIMSLREPEQKMSKSAGEGHFLAMDAPENESLKMIKRAVTDVGGSPSDGKMSPGVANLFTILKALGDAQIHDGLKADHERGELRYSDLKGAVSDAVMGLVRTFQTRKEQYSDEAVRDVLRDGAGKTRPYAAKKMEDVRRRLGLAWF